MSIPVLKCEGLNKSYKKDVPVLQNFNCEIPSGKIVGLLAVNERRLACPVAAEHHIIDYAHVANKTHSESVLRNEGKFYAHLADLKRSVIAEI